LVLVAIASDFFMVFGPWVAGARAESRLELLGRLAAVAASSADRIAHPLFNPVREHLNLRFTPKVQLALPVLACDRHVHDSPMGNACYLSEVLSIAVQRAQWHSDSAVCSNVPTPDPQKTCTITSLGISTQPIPVGFQLDTEVEIIVLRQANPYASEVLLANWKRLLSLDGNSLATGHPWNYKQCNDGSGNE
jgi:hypothetical protein